MTTPRRRLIRLHQPLADQSANGPSNPEAAIEAGGGTKRTPSLDGPPKASLPRRGKTPAPHQPHRKSSRPHNGGTA